ncbi:MAG: ABC transporter ATP-binding protein [Emticicia sp.]|uniref:ABC transporter ATP-binding protein n=1 Tax=Emticicia sp. TaxID=1930953 RepID=UPI003BA63643
MELIIQNLSKTYGNGVKALNDISLTLNRGMFGLLGPNGAGKSSLMRTIATLQEPDSGSITFNDGFNPPIDVLKQKDEVRKVLGYLPQEFGVYPKIDAETLLNHLAVLKGITDSAKRKKTVEVLLEKTNLTNVKNKNLGGYSGGMKQRFGIAQALLGNPQILIVDEPTAGLDPEERNRFLNLLSDLSNDKIIILSTHIVEDVQELCPNVALVNKGQVVFAGKTSEAVDEMRGKVWKDHVKKTNLETYREAMNVISERMVAGETYVHVFDNERIAPHAIEVEPSLEDFYFHRLKVINQN